MALLKLSRTLTNALLCSKLNDGLWKFFGYKYKRFLFKGFEGRFSAVAIMFMISIKEQSI